MDNDWASATAGAIYRIGLTNFMQFDSVSFYPGPHLNVIIGPNGSGKSSIVNALCLGLAGKVSSLGRATNVAQFIRTGRDYAVIEIELFNPDQDVGNWTVERRLGTDGKSTWRLNRRNAPMKEIERLVAELNIQTDNLCQFLPQDKVHEFSRMNSQQLLARTIDAVGEKQLREDHDSLTKLQEDQSKSEELYAIRKQNLIDYKKKVEQLEQQVKNFEEKRKLEEKLEIFEKKKVWLLFEEQKKAFRELQDRYSKAEENLRSEEQKLAPIKVKLSTIKKSRDAAGVKTRDLIDSVKEMTSRSRNNLKRMNVLSDELTDIEDQLSGLNARESERKARVRALETDIARLKAEVAEAAKEDASSTAIETSINQVQRTLDASASELAGITEQMDDNLAQRRGLDSRIASFTKQIDELQNIGRQKMEVLRSMGRSGADACKGIQWLRTGQNKEMFKGTIFEPFLLNINLHDPADALFVENTIADRDLVAFGAEDVDDCNLLMNQLRGMKLNVNVVHLNGSALPTATSLPASQLQKFGFKGFVKDLFEAPPAIMAYLCRHYRMHEIPVFPQGADDAAEHILKQLPNLEGDQKNRVVFIGSTRFQTVSSRYNKNQTSTSSRLVTGRNWLNFSTDRDKLRSLSSQLELAREKNADLLEQKRQLEACHKGAEATREESRNELKKLKQQREHRNTLANRLSIKEVQLRKEARSESAFDQEKASLKLQKENLTKKMLTANDALKATTAEAGLRRQQLEVLRLKVHLQSEIEVRVNEEKAALDEDVTTARDGVSRSAARAAVEREMMVHLRSAQTATAPAFRGEKPPPELQAKFKEAQAPASVEALHVAMGELKAQAQFMEDIDPRVMEEYNENRQAVIELEGEVERHEHLADLHRGRLEEIRQRWMQRLANLIERIASRFSSLLEAMGFAGDVTLSTGQSEQDYRNYGIDILVKFRNNVGLQRLTAHHQSGGERSVSTAIYMLALQELTVVPFRAVDEINQGMDAVNERKVFELLVKTSCRENSAQYFLLTPKLLPDLQYDRNITVLVVNNGEGMCSHKDWDIHSFIAAAKRLTG